MGPQISRRQRRQQNVTDRAQSTGVLTSTGDARATDCLATADAGIDPSAEVVPKPIPARGFA
jgi:hypothetical protein